MKLLLLTAAALPAEAQRFRTAVNPDGTVTINGASSPAGTGALTIPDTIDARKVSSIGEEAFSECWGLISVTIANSVTSIGYGAFKGCRALTSVTIPDSVTNIGAAAFWDCPGLTTVTIPEGVTGIAVGVFRGCSRLTNVTIPKTVTAIAPDAFSGCRSLTGVLLPEGITEIGGSYVYGGGAFSGCSSLTSIVIPASLVRIGEGAFQACTQLTDAYFKGEPPLVFSSMGFSSGETPFYAPATIRYLPGTEGWGSTFSGRPTAPWVRPNPTILDFGDRFGPATNGFSFVISWATNVPVVVEASAEAGAGWTPISTNTLTDGWVQFTDPEWKTRLPMCYRVRAK